jgi:hypothetical protein
MHCLSKGQTHRHCVSFMDVTADDKKVFRPYAVPLLRTRRSETPLPDIRLFGRVTAVELEPAMKMLPPLFPTTEEAVTSPLDRM